MTKPIEIYVDADASRCTRLCDLGNEKKVSGLGPRKIRPRETPMSWRKMLLAAAAVTVVAATFAPTEASAHWRGRGGWGGPAIGLGLGLGIAGAGYYGGGGYGYYGGGYPAYGPGYGGCWRRQVVYTPYGPRARRVWVCG